MYFLDFQGVFWEIDPSGYWNAQGLDGYVADKLDSYVGILPTFFDDSMTEETVEEESCKRYAFRGLEDAHDQSRYNIVDKEGKIIQYPGDPEMWPIMSTRFGELEVVIYRRGVVTFWDSPVTFRQHWWD